MVFDCIEDENNRQRINLSEHAFSVLLGDCSVFREQRAVEGESGTLPSNLLNRIVRCFRGQARSSVALSLKRERQELRGLLPELSPSGEGEAVARTLLERYEKRLTDERDARLRNKGRSISIRLDKENMAYLRSEEGQAEGPYYGNNVGKYLKALLEEYAELVYSERERIYYRNILDELRLAPEEGKMVRLTLHSTREEQGSGGTMSGT